MALSLARSCAVVGLAVCCAGPVASPLGLSSARALELQGRTYFAEPPVLPRSTNYRSNAGEGSPEYMITLKVPTNAGAALGALEITQTRGVDRSFPFNLQQCRAFLGEPRHELASTPASFQFDQSQRRFKVVFANPVAPGQTVTVVLRPWTNPLQSDTYMFSVLAIPAGVDPVGAMTGFATFPIDPIERW